MDVVKELTQIEEGLAWLEEGEMGVDGCFDLQGRFEDLRGSYQKSPGLLEPHMDRLKLLSARFDDYKQAHMQELVDEYHRQNEVMREAKRAKDYLRGLLINEVAVRGTPVLAGRGCTVSIQAIHGPHMPRPGTADRLELEGLIRESGSWEAVSVLSPKMLNTALTQDGFDPETKQAIARLVPEGTTYRVVSKSLQG